MKFHKSDTALVVIDPQNDVLSEQGISWELVGASVRENNTVENLDRLFTAAKEADYGRVHLAPLPLPRRSGVAVRRGGRKADAGEQGVLPSRPARRSTDSPARGPTGSNGTSRTSRTARRWWSALTRCGGRKPTTSSCSSANAASTRSSWLACWPTSASRAICGSCSSRDSKWPWSRTRRPAPDIPEIGDGYKAAVVNYGFIANAVLTTAEVVEAVG